MPPSKTPDAMLSWHDARARITDSLRPLGAEHLALSQAVGRVVAQDVDARRGSPAFANSAMDGYAVRSEDAAQAVTGLVLIETIAAGVMPQKMVGAGQCSRIFTGAPMPDGADAVIMQEDVVCEPNEGTLVRLDAAIELFPGKHVRPAHEDIRAGDPLLRPGDIIGPGDIGVLAGQGWLRLNVYRQPRVAIVPTGDEVMPIDRPLQPGQVPNSNSAMLAAQITEAGGVPIELPVAADDPKALAHTFAQAAAAADIIVSSGGVSVGDFDHVREVLGSRGNMDFWRVRIKPGKPLAFGAYDDCPIIGLPGNPVSSYVCFELFVRPALRQLGGHRHLERPTTAVQLACALPRNQVRLEFIRCRLHPPAQAGEHPIATPCNHQGSGHLSSMLQVDVLVPVESGNDELPAGEIVQAIRLR